MWRLIRILFLSLLGFGLFFVAVSAALWFWGDEILASFRPAIQSKLSALIDGEVTFSSLRVRLIPRLYLHVEDVEIRQPASPYRFHAASTILHMSSRDLWERKLVFDSIDLRGIRMTEQSAMPNQTQPNTAAASPKITSPSPDAPGQGTAPYSSSIDLKRFTVHEAELSLPIKGRVHRLAIESFSSAVNFEAGVLKLTSAEFLGKIDRIGVTAGARLIETNLVEGTLTLGNLALGLNNQRLILNGQAGTTGFPLDLRVEAQQISIPALSQLSALFSLNLSKFTRGVVSGSIDLSRSLPDAWALKGTFAVRDLSIPEWGLGLAEFRLNELNLKYAQGRTTGSSRLSLSQFAMRAKGAGYSLVKGTGLLTLDRKADSAIAINGTLNAEDFGFDDGTTKLERVRATLGDIRASYTSHGDVKVVGMVNGSQLTLRAPGVRVEAIRSVRAPITIEVPRKGGYSVSGPVSANGGVVEAFDRRFADVGGTVSMLISSPRMRFSTAALAFRTLNRALSLATDFSITKDAFTWKDTALRLDSGTFNGEFSMQRESPRTYAGKIAAAELFFTDVAALALGNEQEDITGKLSTLKASVNGSMADALGSMRGSGEFRCTEPLLKNYNLTESVLAAVARLPLSGIVLNPTKVEERGADSASEGVFSIKDRLLTFSKLLMRRSRFTINATGTVGFDKTINLNADVIFLQDSFRSLGFGFDTLGNALSRAGRISIPMNVGATFDSPSITPDIEKFVADNSGLSFIQTGVKKTLTFGESVGRTLLSPFRSTTPTPTPTPTAFANSTP